MDNGKIVNAGVFWAIPDHGEQRVLEVHKRYYESEADANGFINYPYSHFEVWEEEGKGLGSDCYFYPRGRVVYDTKSGKHRIFADRCIGQAAIDEIASLFDIEHYERWEDEHYVCAFCARKEKEVKKLEYTILRGRDKIGENLIEITYGETKLLIELGRALDGGSEELEQKILNGSYTAVIVSHYHEDHAGLIGQKNDCPVYIGAGAYRVVRAMAEYHGGKMPENIRTYRSGRALHIGGICVTPFLCDHSAFDSYMLLFESGGRRILYTGDFRFHGRKNKEKLLAALPEEVDVLIHEGTNLGKNTCTVSESKLENELVEIMKKTRGPVFVMQSGSNLDRLVSVYRASKRSGRLFYMDNYTALIAAAAGGKIPRPDVFSDVVAFTPHPLRGARADAFSEIEHKRGRKAIASGSRYYTMLVRPSMLSYLQKLFADAEYGEATLIYSMWKGYKEREDMAEFLRETAALGVNIIDLHTSGHACAEDIELLKQTVHAKETVCVHTERGTV